MNAAKKILILFMVLVFLVGLAYALYPTINGVILTTSAEYAAEVFLNKREIVQALTPTITDTGVPEETEVPYKDLLDAMEAYNEDIYREEQAGLCDAWAYQEPSFDLTEYGIEDGVIGVISIPKLDIEMPIYLGATYDNMAKGAAHLSQTSLPIGGENTNCVIAGHRGWNGADYFRYIVDLEPGDTVTITNLWEELTYTVSDIKIIDPNDVDEILIQDGKDMLTLLTCHPYGSGGKYRYVIYCNNITKEENYGP